jgi:hypothetical protein
MTEQELREEIYTDMIQEYPNATQDEISELVDEELESQTMGDTCRNGKSWDKCDCC